jgi:uncharacterized protein (TIRG00374 family)
VGKVIYPIILGVIIVSYLIFRQFDIDEFNQINWNYHIVFWVGVAIFLYAIRHLALSLRLYLLSNKEFSFRKSIELIFIWEFSSAVSPTNFGGTAVALFFLSQEKIKTSKAIALVFYTIVLDSFFLLISIPLLLVTLGPLVLRPDVGAYWLADKNVILIAVVFLITLVYGGLLFLGVFVNPGKIRSVMIWLSKRKFLSKYSEKLKVTGDNFVAASKQLAVESWWFHIRAILYTTIAWAIRFGIINILVIAFVSVNITDLFSQLIIYGRSQNLYIVAAYTPTPGSAGFSEILFNGFFKDYVPTGISVIIVILWRLISYYFYLLSGMIIVPHWVSKLLKRRKAQLS